MQEYGRKRHLYFTDVYTTADGNYLASGNNGSDGYPLINAILDKVDRSGYTCRSQIRLNEIATTLTYSEVNTKTISNDLLPYILQSEEYIEKSGSRYTHNR